MHEPEDEIPRSDEERARAERGAALIAAAMAHPEAQAPASLREALATPRPAAPAPARGWSPLRRRRGLVAAGGLALAAVLALVLALGGGSGTGGGRGPTVAQVAALGRLPALGAAPRPAGGASRRLTTAVQGLAFPDWRPRFGWRATGQRRDRVGGRAVTTVFYRRGGVEVGYSIVAGRPVPAPDRGSTVRRGGLAYRVARDGGRTVVSWTQGGHTCVVGAPAAFPYTEVLRLAAWGAV